MGKTTHLRLVALLVMALAGVMTVTAQIDAQLTQYWNAPNYYNPAAIGRGDLIHINAGARLQWVGIKHAPMDFMALGDMPFKFLNRRWGVGLVVQQENIGLYKSLRAGAQLAWKKNMLGGTLNVGVQIGLINQSFDSDGIIIPEGDEYHESNDEAIPASDVKGNAIDFGGGIFFEHKKFWVGISSTHINAPTIQMKVENDEEKVYEFDAGRLYYFMAGSNIPIKHTLFEIQPSLMFKTDFSFYQAEVTARVRYNKFLSGGVAYRYKDAVSLLLGADYKGFFISYSYDYALSAIRKASSGSHELFVGYNLKLNLGDKNKNKHKSIRLM